MPFFLVLDSSLKGCRAGIFDSESQKIIKEFSNFEENRQAEFLAECVHNVWVAREKLEAAIVSIGPGSYTGIRIALSFAESFAFTQNIKTIGANNLLAARLQYGVEFSPVIDTKRGDFYALNKENNLQILKAEELPQNFQLVEEIDLSYLAQSALIHPPQNLEPLYGREAEVSISKSKPPLILGGN